MVNKELLIMIICAALVTWLPRILPFIFVKYKGLPKVMERFLQFLPVSIIFALILSSFTETSPGQLPQIKWLELAALLPTLYVGMRYRNLLATVIFGVILMAGLRFIILLF